MASQQDSTYNPYAATFAKSRQGMKWEEIHFLVTQSREHASHISDGPIYILDVGCGGGRLLETLIEHYGDEEVHYVGIDNSSVIIEESITYAKDLHIPTQWSTEFHVLDMVNIDELDQSFDAIFFIASFHHLQTHTDRLLCLEKTLGSLKPEAGVYMTNWNLLGSLNAQKYAPSITHTYLDGSADFSIKIGAYQRFYHGFTYDSLKSVLEEVGFTTAHHEEWERNFVTIASQ